VGGVVSFDIKTRDGGQTSIERKKKERERRVTNLFVSFPQRSLLKGLSLIFPSFGQEPSSAFVGHENDLGRRWLDDDHTGTQYEVGRVEDAVRYRCSGPL